jgi:serine phosphatase RsbU (regulator of sigma subunit)/anti-sigma regulatory factor (Ser/Thr protein kinase)
MQRLHLGKIQFWSRRYKVQAKKKPVTSHLSPIETPLVDIPPDDPMLAYFLNNPGAVEVEKVPIDSPTLQKLKKAGVKMTIPLVSQGELVGLLNLGARRSDQEYSSDDRRLLNTLASQVAPAIRVAQLAREQQKEALERERVENELRVARLIQQTLLPKELPAIPGWQLTAYYQSAREVGGDFYDFLYFEDGRLGLVIGDVTDKGVPAALVMATTRSILRAAAQQFIAPGKVLEYVNETLFPDIPANMFVTCLYAVLDPHSGLLQYANAGHDLPYCRTNSGVFELYATGMPLGLMPDMSYEQKEALVEVGESILFYSDGLIEAHNAHREMFGFPRAMKLVGEHTDGSTLIEFLLEQLKLFTGDDWEQEDDVTMVTLQRTGNRGRSTITNALPLDKTMKKSNEQMLGEVAITSVPGNELTAMQQVALLVKEVDLSPRQREHLKTAVAEATMNAMEHGNKYHADVLVYIRVFTTQTDLVVYVEDQGGDSKIPDPQTPDLEAKLDERQSPRGWGLFLIKNLVDDMAVTSDGTQHTVKLIMHLEGRQHVS